MFAPFLSGKRVFSALTIKVVDNYSHDPTKTSAYSTDSRPLVNPAVNKSVAILPYPLE